MSEESNNGWREYQKLVLNELRRLDDSVEKLATRVDNSIEKIGIRVDRVTKHERGNRQQVEMGLSEELQRLSLEVHGLKIKAGIWGLLGGLIPALAAIALARL
jgi:hypothetical protein